MEKKLVHIRKNVAAPADALWTLARQFCGTWHPFIEWAKPERDAAGNLHRVFKAEGEDVIYRERLTYFSDTDRELRYCHVEGIRDVTSYKAFLKIEQHGDQSLIEWGAEIEAPEPRVAEIAQGTAVVFEAGIAALEKACTLTQTHIPNLPRLAVTHTAQKAGPLVLFLHGIGGNASNWHKQLHVASRSHQAVALDFRGYGASGLGSSQTTINDHCDDILRVMAHFGKSKVILCGLSLGSWVATSFAMRHPEKLAGLALSGGCTGMSEAPLQEREAFLAARQKPLDEGQSPKDFADGVVTVIAGPNASSETRDILRASMAAIPTATYRDSLWCFTHPEERFNFSGITCPVLMMTGEFDRLASPSEIRGVAHRIEAASAQADVSFEMIEDAGHLCNIENPAAYNRQLVRFLDRLSA